MEDGFDAGSLAEQFMTNWTSPIFRERCVAQIEGIRNDTNPQLTSDDPVQKFLAERNSKELEEFVFEKSSTKEEYMSLIAEVVMMMRQHAGKPLVDYQVLDQADPDELAAGGITPNGIGASREGEGEGSGADK